MKAAAAILISATLLAQQPVAPARPAFDVVAIHPVPPNAPLRIVSQDFTPVRAGGEHVDERTNLTSLIAAAYGIRFPDKQLTGLPNWAKEQSFSVAAKATAAPAGLSQAENRELVHAMLQAMLEDRFQLRIHTETREEPMAGLATSLTLILGRPVIDRTGSTAYYDLDERWTPAVPPENLDGRFTEDGVSVVISGWQDQLGLRLTDARGPSTYWIVDSVQPPNEN